MSQCKDQEKGVDIPRKAREEAESKCYHLTMRGDSRRVLFEDDEDKSYFMDRFSKKATDVLKVYAWCLMDNHAHVLLEGELTDITTLMRSVCTSFANHFNGRHGHVGHVFQGRFHTSPVETEEHLLETVRYIHLNPRDLGVKDPIRYRWSSYAQFLGEEGFCETNFVMELMGSKEDFIRFHDIGKDGLALLDFEVRPRLSDGEADALAKARIGEHYKDILLSMDRTERDRQLARLFALGLSVRQIERLTGIGRGIVYAARKRRWVGRHSVSGVTER